MVLSVNFNEQTSISLQYLYQLTRAMKFKSEYRWLLFILIPFVILLATHIITPLMFLLNSQPLAINQYASINVNNLQTLARSSPLQSSLHVTSYLNKYSSTLQLFSSLLLNNYSYTSIDTNRIQLNNAHSYYLDHMHDNSTTASSMWFATNITNSSQLSTAQLNKFDRYHQIQPFIKGKLQPLLNQNDVVGLFVSFNEIDSQISFHFPSYTESMYSDLANGIISTPYIDISNLNNTNGNIFNLIIQPYASNFKNDTVSICSILNSSNQAIGCICLEISFAQVLNHSIVPISTLAIEGIPYTIYFFQYQPSSTMPNILSIIDTPSNGSRIITYFPNEFYFPTNLSTWTPSICTSSNTISFQTFVQNSVSISVLPICLNQELEVISFPIVYYSIQIQIKKYAANLMEQSTFTSIFQTLLIPILISIFISILISVFVLRFLLNNLDYQLFKINQCCKFIIDGDLNIEIPQFTGTKDIVQVYEQVKLINKLNRYTSKEYFVGFYSNKILKYIQAIQVFQKIGYNPSFLYENIGDAYLFIEQYQKSITYLRQSVDSLQDQMKDQYGPIQKVMKIKVEKDIKLSQNYRQKETILIRRLWKLFFVYIKYVELGMLNSKNFFGQNMAQQQKKTKKQKYHADMTKYITKLKQALFPEFGSYSEGGLLFLFQARFHFSCKNFQAGKNCWEKGIKYCSIYAKEYESNTLKLKEKGSKNKFFHRKNKMSGHSRCSPLIMEAFVKYIEAVMHLFDPKKKNYIAAFNALFEALRKSLISQSVNYLIIAQIRKNLNQLKIGLGKFEHTQVFRESMPFKTLHIGPLTPEIQPLLYRLPKSQAEAQLREFVFMYDVGSLEHHSIQNEKHITYIKERSDYIFDKLMKKIDRISITKFSDAIELQTSCNLTLKDFNQAVLKKTYTDILNKEQFKGKTWLINALSRVIFRIKKLQCEKIIVIFIRPMQCFITDHMPKKLRSKTREKLKKSEKILPILDRTSMDDIRFPEVGDHICELMKQEGMRNCKLFLVCSQADDINHVIKMFGLKDINRRIWAATDGLNKANNVVYIIDEKHKSDIERVLMSKLANYADNHVFVF